MTGSYPALGNWWETGSAACYASKGEPSSPTKWGLASSKTRSPAGRCFVACSRAALSEWCRSPTAATEPSRSSCRSTCPQKQKGPGVPGLLAIVRYRWLRGGATTRGQLPLRCRLRCASRENAARDRTAPAGGCCHDCQKARLAGQRKVAGSGGSLGEIQTWHVVTGQPRSFGANP